MNPKLFVIALGATAYYLFGTDSGRANLAKAKKVVTDYWESPRVAAARDDLETYTRAQAPVIRERAEAAAKAAPRVVADAAKDVAAATAATAKDVAGKVAETASDVRDQAVKAAADLRERGEAAVESVVATAGEARDKILDVVDDEDDDDDDNSRATSPGNK